MIDEGEGEIINVGIANVEPILSNAYDANVTNSTAESVVCASETDIAITFRNYGNQNLTSLDLTYDINGSTDPSINPIFIEPSDLPKKPYLKPSII